SVAELASGKWDTEITLKTSRDEVGDLTGSFKVLADYIRSYIAHITELNKAYFHFVPEQFLQYLKQDSITKISLGDQVQQEMSVLFSDIRGFTSISEKMTPKENFDFLNRYLSVVGPRIRENRGFVDKYLGDAIMALFPHDADDSVKAAVDIVQTLRVYNQNEAKAGRIQIATGVGINTGSLMLGILGEAERMDGTVISDNVNLASRLEGLTKHFGANIIISDTTYTALKNPDRWLYRELGSVKVKGKQGGVTLYEVLDGGSPEERENRIRTKPAFSSGVAAFKKSDFAAALKAFSEVTAADPSDKAAALYLSNIAFHQSRGGHPEEFDGTIEMHEK
ncbi:MAG: adenylate/guanylate cyclase domain-containing protein, partial [Thermodesulfobacteriota bacterium]